MIVDQSKHPALANVVLGLEKIVQDNKIVNPDNTITYDADKIEQQKGALLNKETEDTGFNVYPSGDILIDASDKSDQQSQDLLKDIISPEL